MSGESTREKILDAVFKLVYINGYNGTSMSMILKECGIPKGSLYHYFKSKKELVLHVLRERLAPRMDDFYALDVVTNEDSLNAIIDAILRVAQKEELLLYGCPLNRLNQEMSPLDKDFEQEITKIYEKLKLKIKNVLDNSKLKSNIDTAEIAAFIITTVWGSLSLSPSNSSKEQYLNSVKHLINYLKSLKK